MAKVKKALITVSQLSFTLLYKSDILPRQCFMNAHATALFFPTAPTHLGPSGRNKTDILGTPPHPHPSTYTASHPSVSLSSLIFLQLESKQDLAKYKNKIKTNSCMVTKPPAITLPANNHHLFLFFIIRGCRVCFFFLNPL